MRGLACAALLAAGVLSLWASEPEHAQTLPAETVSRIDAIFSEWASTDSPGCALAVSRGARVVLERGYGMSNLEYDIAIRPNSIFHVASISKQFAAFSVALLAADGKLSLDDDVRKHVPELPDYGRKVTIRHLMHHTSGIRDQWTLLDMAGWRDDDLITEEDVLDILSRQRSLNFEPGAEYLYSNSGYTLLGVIVKRVSGSSLRDFAEQRIFAPLGMHDTHFHDDHSMIVRNRTSAYRPRAGGGWSISIPVFDTYGATSLFTTVADLLAWQRNFTDARVGGRELLAGMQVSGRLNDGQETGYGLGLAIGSYRGLRTVGHAGADAGYRSDVVRFPEHDVAVAAFCNASSSLPGLLTRRVAEVLIGDRMEPTAPVVTIAAAQQESLAGAYWNPITDDVRRFAMKDGRLTSTGAPRPLDALGGGRFRIPNSIAEVIFPPVSGGVQELHVLQPPMKPAIFRQLPPPAETGGLKLFFADYRSDEIGVVYSVREANGKLALKAPRKAAVELERLGPDLFVGQGRVVTFSRKGADIQGFTFSAGRVRRIAFTRVQGTGTRSTS